MGATDGDVGRHLMLGDIHDDGIAAVRSAPATYTRLGAPQSARATPGWPAKASSSHTRASAAASAGWLPRAIHAQRRPGSSALLPGNRTAACSRGNPALVVLISTTRLYDAARARNATRQDDGRNNNTASAHNKPSTRISAVSQAGVPLDDASPWVIPPLDEVGVEVSPRMEWRRR